MPNTRCFYIVLYKLEGPVAKMRLRVEDPIFAVFAIIMAAEIKLA